MSNRKTKSGPELLTQNCLKKNRLLLKDDVGKAKACPFALPKDRTYGRAATRDAVGVAALTGSWVNHVSSPPAKKAKDFARLNRGSQGINIYKSGNRINQYESLP